MPEIDRFRPEDRRAIDALYRRVFGHDAAESSRLRWNWQYLNNPSNPPDGPQIWVAREGQTIVGQYATMPVRLHVAGNELDGSWGMDVMVAPERQRQGLGEVLFRKWDRHVGASLGLGLSDSSYRLFQKLKWPDMGPVPCHIKPLTGRALSSNWLRGASVVLAAVALPIVRSLDRAADTANIRLIRKFDAGFNDLWEKVAPKFKLSVRRDAAYLNWKFTTPPHVRYSIAAFERDRVPWGYIVYRHAQEPRGRVTLIVDFLADPDDLGTISSLLRWVDAEARACSSDKIRCFAMHASFRRALRRSGYFNVKSTMEFVVKVNGAPVPPDFYEDASAWHVTLGDSDQDR